jgi:hypothetical protein
MPPEPGFEKLTAASISFTIPLASALGKSQVHYITQAQQVAKTLPSGCSGTFDAPAASSGNLCVFEGIEHPAIFRKIVPAGHEPGAEEGAGVAGARISIQPVEETGVEFSGTWAVRG